MKIIKNPKEAWSAQISCRQCSALLEIVDTDIYMAELGSGMDNSNSENCYVVDCAVCKRFIELDPAKLPEWVRRERKTARRSSP